jgi:hypothetical protein
VVDRRLKRRGTRSLYPKRRLSRWDAV